MVIRVIRVYLLLFLSLFIATISYLYNGKIHAYTYELLNVHTNVLCFSVVLFIVDRIYM